MPRSSMPRTCCICFRISVGIFSRSLRFGPMILTELAPLTPESASSTLSWMYWEKLNTTPGSAASNSCCSCAVSLSLVIPAGHCS